MDEPVNLMTQSQIAEKYEVDKTAISNAIAMAGVSPVSKTREGRGQKLYDEKSVAIALVRLYKSRMNGHIRNAEEWKARAEKIRAIYREGE